MAEFFKDKDLKINPYNKNGFISMGRFSIFKIHYEKYQVFFKCIDFLALDQPLIMCTCRYTAKVIVIIC